MIEAGGVCVNGNYLVIKVFDIKLSIFHKKMRHFLNFDWKHLLAKGENIFLCIDYYVLLVSAYRDTRRHACPMVPRIEFCLFDSLLGSF